MSYAWLAMTITDVRTFNARRGRLRAGRVDALARLLPQYLPDTAGLDGPVVLEIGSGMGEATVAMAVADPQRLYVAVEVLDSTEMSIPAAVYSVFMFVFAAGWGALVSRRVRAVPRPEVPAP